MPCAEFRASNLTEKSEAELAAADHFVATERDLEPVRKISGRSPEAAAARKEI